MNVKKRWDVRRERVTDRSIFQFSSSDITIFIELHCLAVAIGINAAQLNNSTKWISLL